MEKLNLTIIMVIIIIVSYGVGTHYHNSAQSVHFSDNIKAQVLNCIHEQVFLVNYVASNRSRSSAVPFQEN